MVGQPSDQSKPTLHSGIHLSQTISDRAPFYSQIIKTIYHCFRLRAVRISTSPTLIKSFHVILDHCDISAVIFCFGPNVNHIRIFWEVSLGTPIGTFSFRLVHLYQDNLCSVVVDTNAIHVCHRVNFDYFCFLTAYCNFHFLRKNIEASVRQNLQ